jgi:S-disulfanyl-L-cysteine oxidoreductase SoxD
MFRFHRTVVAVGVSLVVALLGACAAGSAFAADKAGKPGSFEFSGIGRGATPQEIAAWDIDVRPDFKGLPAGAGSVAKGQEVWEGKCASCHGVFGESNEVFAPLIGGTTAEDIKTGHVANLKRSDYPGRTTLMKASSLSTLWDYINRAMPWTQPKSLTVEEVYAVTAYMLNLGNVVPADFALSDKNIREVQQRLPNRNGMTTAHALWPGKELGGSSKPDVAARACMKDCAPEPKVSSILPPFARNAHGNLAEQNRAVGAQRGAETARPERALLQGGQPLQQLAKAETAKPEAAKQEAAASGEPRAANAPIGTGDSKAIAALMQKNNCTACHAAASKVLGPSWADVASKHQGKTDYLAGKIKAGGSGVWGAIPMPPQTLTDDEARRIAGWLASGALP